MDLDSLDKHLLEKLQQVFPIVEEPFQELGQSLGINAKEVMERIHDLKKQHIIREICAVFDSRALGYQSSLVALALTPDKLEDAASTISKHPGVSHNYAREYKYNLWFTLALPPGENMKQASEELAKQVGAEGLLVLPAIKVFKIGAFFHLSEQNKEMVNVGEDSHFSTEVVSTSPLNPLEIAIIKELQKDISLEERPFLSLAGRLGIKESEVLSRAKDFLSRRLMRRFAALIYHRHLGFLANGMCCWRVTEERIAEVGMTMAAYSQVTHCYQRVTYPDWTYNLFTMVHSRTRKECRDVIKMIAQKVKVDDYMVLFSTKEFKKATVKYYW